MNSSSAQQEQPDRGVGPEPTLVEPADLPQYIGWRLAMDSNAVIRTVEVMDRGALVSTLSAALPAVLHVLVPVMVVPVVHSLKFDPLSTVCGLPVEPMIRLSVTLECVTCWPCLKAEAEADPLFDDPDELPEEESADPLEQIMDELSAGPVSNVSVTIIVVVNDGPNAPVRKAFAVDTETSGNAWNAAKQAVRTAGLDASGWACDMEAGEL